MWSTIQSVISSFLGVFTSVCNFLLGNQIFLIIIGMCILSVVIRLIYAIIHQIRYNSWLKNVSGYSYREQMRQNKYARTHTFEEYMEKYYPDE